MQFQVELHPMHIASKRTADEAFIYVSLTSKTSDIKCTLYTILLLCIFWTEVCLNIEVFFEKLAHHLILISKLCYNDHCGSCYNIQLPKMNHSELLAH